MVTATLCNRLWLSMFLLACFLLPVNMAIAALTTSVDRTVISKNDIILLTVRSDQGPLQQTDFNELEKSFSVLNQRRSNQISIINGDKQATYDLTLALLPKGDGTLTIPAFKSRGESSQAIQIEVSAGPLDSQQSHQQIFFDNEVNKQQVYVQEQLLYTLRMFHSVGLSEAQITPLNVEHAVIEFVGEQKKYQTVIDGIRYSVVERQYAIFPEKSGPLILPALIFTGRAISNHNNYNSRSNPNNALSANGYIRIRSESHTIEVLPTPNDYPASQVWLPTPALHINDSWDDNSPTLTVGEPVTRTLTISAANLTAAQLPDLILPATAQLKIYPDQAQDEDRVIANGLMGQRSFSSAIVPSIAGTIQVPAIEMVWWNTDSKQLEVTTVPAKTLTVSPAASSDNPPQQFTAPLNTVHVQSLELPQDNQQSSGIWPWLSLVFALLWFGTAFRWRQTLQASNTQAINELTPSQMHLNTSAAYKSLKKCCLQGDAKAARQSLIDWFRLNHTEPQFRQLKDITQLYQDEQLSYLIRELESYLYSNMTTLEKWNGVALIGALERVDKATKLQQKNNARSELNPLYPF